MTGDNMDLEIRAKAAQMKLIKLTALSCNVSFRDDVNHFYCAFKIWHKGEFLAVFTTTKEYLESHTPDQIVEEIIQKSIYLVESDILGKSPDTQIKLQ